ncbi:IclR family transcriptional regulator [Arthrobacter sp. NPDC089319]|uniref:IclR family transcriptional regulator n=1 Tax=Arthrobacter sp. NPDC089319 TaxID=3155915 RepID=UPI003423A7C9
MILIIFCSRNLRSRRSRKLVAEKMKHTAAIGEAAAEPLVDRRSVLERASRILGSFDQSNQFQSLSAVSRTTGLPLTTAHRIVTELLSLGLLERDETDRLSIGTELWKIALCAPKASGLQRIALPFMQDMYSATGLPIHLGVAEGYEVLFIESLRSEPSTDERPRLGAKYPMHITAVGMALLAHMPEAFVKGYLKHIEGGTSEGALTEKKVYSRPNEFALRRELAGIRAEGYSLSDRQAEPNAVALGAPICLGGGRPIGAISIIVPWGKEHKPYALLVRTTARSIQRLLSEPT